MNLEPRIRAQLELELMSASIESGSLDNVLARGQRRRLAYRTGQGLAAAVAAIVAIASTALIINTMASRQDEAEPAAQIPSPLTGTELTVLSDDPLVLRGESGPRPMALPEGTEIRLQPIETLLPVEEEILKLEQRGSATAIIALGAMAQERYFAVLVPAEKAGLDEQLILVAINSDDQSSTSWTPDNSHRIRAIDDSTVWLAFPASPALVILENASPATSFVEFSANDNTFWQVPVEGIAVISFKAPTHGTGLMNLWDSERRHTVQFLVYFEDDQGTVSPPPSVVADWFSTTHLLASSPEWTERLDLACSEGVWDLEVAKRLATQFIAEDLARPREVDREFRDPTPREGAESLWRMSTYYCREAFPPGEIEAGPFMTAALEGLENAIANRNPWDEVAAAPIAGRYAHASAWTGEHVLIWGGIHKPSDPEPDLADGARYHPQQNLWRMLPPAPAGMSGPARSVWTGEEWIVRTDHVPDGPVQMASYDPTADEWTEIAAAELGWGDGYAMVWTGEEVIFYGGATGDSLTGENPMSYNPTTDNWRELPAPPIGQRTSPAAVWTGNELIIWGGKTSCSPDGDSTCTEFVADGAAYDPVTDSWRVLADSEELPADSPVSGWAWTGTELLILYTEECDDGTCLTGHALHVARNEWRQMPDLEGAAFLSNPPVWTANEGFRSLLYVWDRTGAGFSYHAVDDEWTSLGQYPIAERFGATVVAVGPQVFVWGGWDGAAANDPFDDGFMSIP